MKSSKGIIISLGLVFIPLFVAGYIVWPPVSELYTDLRAIQTQQAIKNDYKLHTTPLPLTVGEDICLKLDIKESSEHCQSNNMVFAPDFFDEIKTYFGNLPDQDKTYELVQDKLGAYSDHCEKPAPDGHYRCIYDIRGDERYPIFFYFSKDGFYYRIIANTGGS